MGAISPAIAAQNGISAASASPFACSARRRGPLADRRGLGRQLDPLAALERAVGGLEILEQDAPGDAVDRQVMGDHEQLVAPPLAHPEQDDARDRAGREVEALLQRRPARPPGPPCVRRPRPAPGRAPRRPGTEPGGSSRRRGSSPPSTGSKRERRTSWCSNSASTVAARQTSSSGCMTSSSTDWFQWWAAGRPRAKNQRSIGGRRDLADHRALLGERRRPRPRRRPPARRRSGSGTPAARSGGCPSRAAREISWIDRIESPPSSKKLSWMPTRSTPQQLRPDAGERLLGRRCAAARRRCRAPAGRPARGPAAPCGRACRWRSAAAPASATNAAGTMYSGQLRCTKARSSPAVGAGAPARHHVGDQPLLAAGATSLAREHRPPRAPRGAAPSAASISPSSMRKPRILTWWSTPAEELQVAVGADSGRGRRCGRAAPASRAAGTGRARTAPRSASARPA